jgi:hypothetical protein
LGDVWTGARRSDSHLYSPVSRLQLRLRMGFDGAEDSEKPIVADASRVRAHE